MKSADWGSTALATSTSLQKLSANQPPTPTLRPSHTVSTTASHSRDGSASSPDAPQRERECHSWMLRTCVIPPLSAIASRDDTAASAADIVVK